VRLEVFTAMEIQVAVFWTSQSRRPWFESPYWLRTTFRTKGSCREAEGFHGDGDSSRDLLNITIQKAVIWTSILA